MKALYLTGLYILIVIGACSQARSDSTACTIEIEKSRSYSSFNSEDAALRAPLAARYMACGKEFTFLASEHTSDPDSVIFTFVSNMVAEMDLDIVLLEGLSYQDDLAWLRDWAKNIKDHSGDNEIMQAARAAPHSLTLIGAEPTDLNILTGLQTAGYDMDDLLGYYILRSLPSDIAEALKTGETSPDNPESLRNWEANMRAHLERVFEKDFKAFDFPAWYEDTNGVSIYTGYNMQDAWPSHFQDRPTNRLGDRVADIRDQFTLGLIQETLRTHDNVMIIQGASHYALHKDAFEKAMGEPEIILP